MAIRMIGMDFDGTLMDCTNGKPFIDCELIEWLSCFIEDGNYAGIVSGRNAQEIRDIVEHAGYQWGKPFPCFCIHREAFINIIGNGRDISYEEYNGSARKRISDLMLFLGKYVEKWSKEMKREGLLIESWNLYGDFGLEFALPDLSQAQSAVILLDRYLAQEGIKGFYVHRNGKLATVIDESCGKGNVLLKTAQYFGLLPCEVLAVGDSINDMTMVDGRNGFTGSCVGNGDELLKKAVLSADGYIGDGIASIGILDIIKQLFAEDRLKKYCKGSDK